MQQGPQGPYSEKVMEHFMHPRNVGDMPDADGIGHVGNPVCVIPQTIVYTNPSAQAIDNIEEGTKVLGHDGFFHSVEKVHNRFYKGPVFNIDVHSLGNLVATPEHHILAINTGKLTHKHRDYRKGLKDWYLSLELKKGDTLLFPILKETQDREFMDFDIEKLKWDHRSKELPNTILIDKDFLRLVGYYLSEGSVVTKPCKGRVFFTFGSHEKDYVDDVKNIMKRIFGLESNKIRHVHNSTNVIFSSARLARFFEKHFGKGAQNKHLPHWMLLLPGEKQEALLSGLWRGDGYINNAAGKFVTISKILAHQVKILLMRQKIIFSFLTIPQQGIHKENYCIYIKSREAKLKVAEIMGKNIEVSPRVAKTQKAWYDDEYFYTTIDKIEETFYKGLVYNLEVEGSHSYVSEAATLHNCGDIMELYIKVKDDVILDAKFKTFGCGAAIATSSMVTDLVKGKGLKEALEISNRAVAEALGGLPKIKMHCSVLAEQALRSAIRDFLIKQNRLSEFPQLKDAPADGMDDNHNH